MLLLTLDGFFAPEELYERYDGAKDPDKVLITLASYNVGRGHILDAQKIAKERNLDPNSWSSLEVILSLLRTAKVQGQFAMCTG